MKNIRVREVLESELEELKKISIQTFSDAFGEANSKANFKKYLNESFNTMQLRNELRNTESSFYFVESQGDIIGYLKLNMKKAQTDQIKGGLEIERIYISKEHQGKKIGKLLLDYALDVADYNKNKVVWLGVWSKNHSAIRFYQRHGFIEFDKHTFMLGQDKQIDLMMKLEL